MSKRTYNHSAYWYAKNYGWTYSEAGTYTGRYLDMHSYHPKQRKLFEGIHRHQYGDADWNEDGNRMNADGRHCDSSGEDSKSYGKNWFERRRSETLLDTNFNPLLFGICIAMDIGVAIREEVRKLTNPCERDRVKRELMRDLRIVRRPFYYFRETERRRQLAVERRKIVRRKTTAPMPTPEDVLSAWNARKTSREAMILLGGMLDDLSCHVDSCLKFDENGTVVGRNGGIRGWLQEYLPELSPKYKTLMRYKALATRLRQATETSDPTPTSELLDKPRKKVVETILSDPEPVFSRVFAMLEHLLSPNTVLLDEPKAEMRAPPRRSKRKKPPPKAVQH